MIFKALIRQACFFIGLFLTILSYGQNQVLADSLVRILDNPSTRLLTDSIIWEIAVNHTDQDSILYYSNQLIQRNSLDSQLIWLFRGYVNKGHAYKQKGDLEEALYSFFTAEGYARKMNRHEMIGGCFVAIADTYKRNNNHNNSILYYNKSIDIFRELNDSIPLASALLNAGDEYFNYDELDSALIYFQESGEIFGQQKFELGIAYNLGNVGLVYAKQGKHNLAEENIKAATEILEELGDRYPIAVYDTYMADIYLEKGDLPRALKYAHHSLQIGQEDGLKEQIRDASLKLSELYEVAKGYENAFIYQKQYIAYRDSINNEETIRKMADLRTEYEVGQKQIEVDLLKEKQKGFFFAVFFLVLLLLLIGTLAYVFIIRNREKQAANILLTNQTKELEELNATKDRFFSIISHDLRSPVNAFKGLSSLIKFSVDQKKYNELPEITERINSASDKLSMLLDNLLEWAINQQGRLLYAPEKINLNNLIVDSVPIFKDLALAKNIELKIDVNESAIIWAEPNSIMTILRNLINNAIKFTEVGGEVVVKATCESNQAILVVSDNGVGIHKDKIDSLFQLKEKKSSWGTEGEKGLGLGLRLTHEFVELNKGSIQVESEEGIGSTFTVKIPLYSDIKNSKS